MEPNTVILDQFRINDFLAEGGMAEVFMAEHLRTGTNVVVKVMKGNMDKDEVMRKRFLREVQNSKLLVHPNIVKVYGGGEFRGDTFMVMEFMDGGTLANAIDEVGQLPWPAATAIMIQILGGLEYSHGLKIIHRDMKPDNLLVNRRGEVKITDFGISKALEQTVMTQEGEILGTPAYMAPEQITGAPVAHSSDIFSSGVIFLEMLLGQNPFLGNGINETVSRIISFKEPPLEDLDETVPESVRVALTRMLSKTPESRFASAQEAKERLRYILDRHDLNIGTSELKTLFRNPTSGVWHISCLTGRAMFKQAAEEGQQLTLRNVADAFAFAERILKSLEFDPANQGAINYLRQFLKNWNTELPRDTTKEILLLEEECRESGLERAKFEQLIAQHQAQNNHLDVIFYLGALADSDPGDPTLKGRITAAIEDMRRSLEYRLVGGAAPSVRESATRKLDPGALDDTITPAAPAAAPAMRTQSAKATTRQPAAPKVARAQAAPKPTPSRRVPNARPTSSVRAVAKPVPEKPARSGLFVWIALTVLFGSYSVVSYVIADSPVHKILDSTDPTIQAAEMTEEEISRLPDGGLSYYQGLIRDRVKSRETYDAYVGLLEILHTTGQAEEHRKVFAEFKTLFPNAR